MPSTDIHNTQIELFRSESRRFREYLNTLSPESLDLPSACEKWNVGEVIAHLAWAVETYGGMMARGLHGDQSPIEGFPSVPPGTPGRQAIVDQYYAQAAIDLRRSLGEKLFSALNEQYDWLNEVLASIGPEDWEKPCYHHAGLRSMESFIPTWLAELALHEWDIRSTLEPSPHLSEKSLPALMEKLPSNRRPWAIPFETAAAPSGPMYYRFDLDGVVSGSQDVIVENGSARLEPAGDAAADVTIRCRSDLLPLLMYGRLTLEGASAAGLAKVEGDHQMVLSFDRWLQK